MEPEDFRFNVFVQSNEDNERMMEESIDDPEPVSDGPIPNAIEELGQQTIETGPQNAERDTSSRSRKRQRNPDQWKSNIRKRLRESGKEYVDRQGKQRAVRKIKGECKGSCRFKCTQHINQEERLAIHSQFWKLSDDKKSHFYGKFIDHATKNRCRTLTDDSRRKFSLVYNFQVGEKRVRVCKEFFLTTLDISQRRVQYYFQKVHNRETGVPRSPLKGKLTKSHIADERKQHVRDHINSFPRVESHYCRATTSCEYLDMFLNIKEMYRLYTESGIENPVKESLYRSIFNNEFNLRFHQRKKDRCDHCEEAKAQGLNQTESQKEIHDLHIKHKLACKQERDSDRALYGLGSNGQTAVICFDLENVFSLPRAEISNFFYKRKLACYNLTAHCSLDKKSYNALWHECISGRGGNHIASSLVKILRCVIQDHPQITKLILWSDACVPQNRNSIMSIALKTFLSNNQKSGGNLKIIEQKFSEPGHGNIQEVDNVHSQIEKWLESREVFSPVSLLRSLVQLGRRANMQFIQVKKNDFLNFQGVSSGFNLSLVPYTKVKHLSYCVNSIGTVDYRINFNDEFTTVRLWRPKSGRQSKSASRPSTDKLIDTLPAVHVINITPSLTEEKKKDIRSMFRYMNDEDKAFYNVLM